MNNAANNKIKQAASAATPLAVPYIAVLLGLYGLHNAWAAILLYHAAMLAFIILKGKTPIAASLTKGFNWKIAAASAIVSALCGLVIVLLWNYARLEQSYLADTMTTLGLHGPSWRIFSIYFVTVHPIIEESYWRGFISAAGKFPLLPDIAFAGYHVLVLIWFVKWPWALLAFALIAAAGCSWRLINRKLAGLAVPLIAHIAADLSIILAVYRLLH